MTNTTDPTRKAQTGEPGNKGEFGSKPRPDAEVTLSPGRTAFGGYELRGFKQAGQGMEGRIWTGTIYRNGRAVVHVTQEGNGGPMRYVEKATGVTHGGPEIDTFKAKASEFFPEEYSAEDDLAEILQFSAELDKLAKRAGATRAEVVNDHIAHGVIQESERLLFIDPDGFLRNVTP